MLAQMSGRGDGGPLQNMEQVQARASQAMPPTAEQEDAEHGTAYPT